MVSPQELYGGSIGVNPRVANIDINEAATDWLWAVFAVMTLSTLGFLFWSRRRPVGTRTFHQLPILILTTASIAYFSMASNLGATAVRAEFPRGATPGVTRSIWYVRYIDWTITTPLLLLELLLNTGLPLSDIVTVIFIDLVMIITGLVGALVATRYKWGYFAFGCAALFYIWYVLLSKGSKAALALGTDVRSAYIKSTYFLMFLWLLYPIAWGVSEGGNVISPLKEMIFYGILDILAKPVFCFYHAWQISRIPYERFMLQSGKASVGAAAGYNQLDEKHNRNSTAGYAGLGAAATGAPGTAGVTGAGSALGTGDHPGHSAAGPNVGANTTGTGPLNGRNGHMFRTNSGRAAAEAGTAPGRTI